MSRIWSMMDIGKRSMMNSQTSLQTTAHNISNKGTQGYSRQRVEIQSNVPVGSGNLRIGMGARASKVTRTNNPHLEKQIEREGGELGREEAKSYALGRVEQVYNEQTNKGLNKYLTEFFNSFRELSNSPESISARTLVKESADFLAKDFHRVSNQLDAIQGDIDQQITSSVLEINEITKEIASLNEKVQAVELSGVPANDERDRRDALLKDLSKKVNIRYAENGEGQVTVTAGRSAVLVSGFSHRSLEVSGTVAREGKREGRVDIFYRATETGSPFVVTDQFTGGKIGGLLGVRDGTINDLFDNMDEMAFNVAKEVNDAHSLGYDRYNKRSGRFFEVPKTQTGASSKIALSAAIQNDVGKIAVGAAINSPGDNRVANVISGLQYKGVMSEGDSTFDGYYSNIVGRVGVQSARSHSSLQAQEDIVKQLGNIRESISGVSLDEETAKMIEFQKTFDASARLIRTADEMMDTVLNIKRM